MLNAMKKSLKQRIVDKKYDILLYLYYGLSTAVLYEVLISFMKIMMKN